MNKLFKRILSLLLILTLIGSFGVSAMAEEAEGQEPAEETAARILVIDSAEDFLRFAKNCVRDRYSENLEVRLEADLDFTGMAFTAVPSFSGTFLGNHHTMKGITLSTEGSNQGVFRYLTETALVKDLTVLGEFLPEGSKNNVGSIAGSNSGRIQGCHLKGRVSGNENVGGIAGRNQVTGIIEDSMVTGSVRGIHFAGGITGANFGVVRNCKNMASVNVKEEDNQIDSVRLDKEFLMGKEAVETTTDLGGIAGSNAGVIRSCANHGNVGYPKMGYNLGGIAGSSTGYIVGCKNSGTIQGRKEIAGIAGQLEPVIEINFQEDTIQILRRQLNETSALANRASSNISANSQELRSDITSLHDSTGVAIEAVEALIPKDGVLPDLDTIIAAHNSLSSSVGSIHGSLSRINGSAQSMVGSAAADIRAITNSVREISQTLDQAAETLGGTLVDISDLDTPEDLEGKIQDCYNAGPVSGDRNVGGIAGAVAWENDLDPEEDYTVSGDQSLNFDSKLRAVILTCSNEAKIQVAKKNGGGIAGNLTLGLVKNSLNTGPVEGENADYMGGIAGTSLGYIRGSSAKCQLTGHSFLGGIAGSASILSNCTSTVLMDAGGEQLGSILGDWEENRTEEEAPIRDNYYLPLSDHLGAIDGIDYYGSADSLNKEAFLALPELPSMFFSSTMTFQFPDGSRQRLTVPLGSPVKESQFPRVPEKDGCLGYWDMPEALDLNHMFFDVTLEAIYEGESRVLESTVLRADGKPVLLAEGSFGSRKTMEIQKETMLPQKHLVGSGWVLPDFGTQEDTVLHLTIPDGIDARDARALRKTAEGLWEETESKEDRSYLLFSVKPGDQAVAIYGSQTRLYSKIAAAAGSFAALLILLITLRILKKRKLRKEAKKQKS